MTLIIIRMIIAIIINVTSSFVFVIIGGIQVLKGMQEISDNIPNK